MKHYQHQSLNAAFSLIELMITIGIVMLITGIALIKYGSFNNSILLRSQAFELALDIRQAQQYAISVNTDFSGYDQYQGIGMYFDLNNSGRYTLYQDSYNGQSVIDKNKPISYNNGEAILPYYLLDPRFKIARICFDGNTPCNKTNASVAFRRPNFDARIYDGSTPATQVDIVLEPVNGSGASRTVTVYSSGQVQVH